jgi:hypothetical protein
LAKAVNGWLYNISIRASGDEGIRDYMDVGVIGYRTDQQANPIIQSALVGSLAGRRVGFGDRHRQLSGSNRHHDAAHPGRRDGEWMEFPAESPIWVDPVAEGSTPMCHVLYHAYQVLSQWIQQHPDSFPPIVITYLRRRIAGRRSDSRTPMRSATWRPATGTSCCSTAICR